jgi:hypothetical protein
MGQLAPYLQCGGKSCDSVTTPELDKPADCQDAPFPGAVCSAGFECSRCSAGCRTLCPALLAALDHALRHQVAVQRCKRLSGGERLLL